MCQAGITSAHAHMQWPYSQTIANGRMTGDESIIKGWVTSQYYHDHIWSQQFL